MNCELGELPQEVLLQILYGISDRDLSQISQINALFSKLSKDEELWIHRAKKDFQIELKTTDAFSPREFYQKVLHKYGRLLGYWRRLDRQYYGGMLKVSFHENSLKCWSLEAPQSVEQDVIQRELVTISKIKEDKEVSITCPHNEGESVIVEYLQTTSNPSFKILFGKEDDTNQHLYELLKLTATYSGAPIQPGLFNGTYGPHGVELIHLRMTHAGMDGASGIKITGDPNVPFSKASFIIDSDKCVDVPIEMQQSTDLMEQCYKDVEWAVQYQDGLSLDFRIPDDAWVMPGTNTLLENYRSCRGRWPCRCQVADTGFINPQLSPGVFVVLSEDIFAVLLFKLKGVLVYHRVKNLL